MEKSGATRLCFLIFLMVSVLMSVSCRKRKEQIPELIVTPLDAFYQIDTSAVVIFKISGSSKNDLTKFTISKRVNNSSLEYLLDTELNQKSFMHTFQYEPKNIIDSSVVLLEFILIDEYSNFSNVIKKITVTVNDPGVMVESAGHEIYSSLSGKFDAYNLSTGVPIYSPNATVSDTIHIQSGEELGSDIFKRKWISPEEIKFVKFSSFDYGNCTLEDSKNAYNASVKLDFVDELSVGDILISKLDDNDENSFVVLKIIYIVDLNGAENDKIIFNIKKLK